MLVIDNYNLSRSSTTIFVNIVITYNNIWYRPTINLFLTQRKCSQVLLKKMY